MGDAARRPEQSQNPIQANVCFTPTTLVICRQVSFLRNTSGHFLLNMTSLLKIGYGKLSSLVDALSDSLRSRRLTTRIRLFNNNNAISSRTLLLASLATC